MYVMDVALKLKDTELFSWCECINRRRLNIHMLISDFLEVSIHNLLRSRSYLCKEEAESGVWHFARQIIEEV